MGRTATIARKTKETDITISLDVDGSGQAAVETGMPFFNHMLDAFSRHGFFNIDIQAKGDLEVDYHHTVEDVGLALGQAFKEALGDKAGIRRFGEASCPLDETLAKVVIDLSGRPYLSYNVKIRPGRVGDFDTDLPHEFFAAFANHHARQRARSIFAVAERRRTQLRLDALWRGRYAGGGALLWGYRAAVPQWNREC